MYRGFKNNRPTITLGRKIGVWIVFFTVFFVNSAFIARADELQIKTSFLEDASNQKSFGNVQQEPTTSYEGFLNRGYSKSTYWIRIDVSNAPIHEPLVLTVSPYYLDEIALFDPSSGLQSSLAGITYPPREEVRAFLPHTFLLPPHARSETYWLRIRSRSSIIVSLNITPVGAAYIVEAKRNFLSALYIGCILMFALIGVALAWRSKDPAFYFFPIFEIGAAIFALNLFGYFGLWLRPVLSPDAIARTHQLATVIAALTAGIFHTLFLRGLGVGSAWLAVATILIIVNFSEFGLIAANAVQPALQTNAVLCLIYSVLFLAMALSLPNRRTPGEFPKPLIVSYYAISFVIVGLMALQLQGVRSPIDNVFFGNISYGFFSGILMFGMLTWRTLRSREREFETRESLALAVDGARLGVWRYVPEDRLVTVSDKFGEHFGLPLGVRIVSYDKILYLIHPDDREGVDLAFRKCINDRIDFAVEHRVILPDGSEHWIYGHGRPRFLADDTLERIDGITMDLTDRKIADENYKKALATVRAAFSSMKEGVLILDAHGNVVDSNEAAASFLRFKDPEIPKTYEALLSSITLASLDGHAIERENYPYRSALRGISKTSELRLRRSDTGEAWFGLIASSPIFGGGDEIIGAAITGLDISDRIEARRRLEEEVKRRTAELATANATLLEVSRHDPLTGLHNRLAGNERLRSEFGRMKRTGEVYSVLMLDIDLFKNVNDSCGHAIGDEVLKLVANTLSKNVREYDFIARWGGEEFLILLPATEFDEACIVAEKLRFAVEAETHPIAGTATVSVGVATALLEEVDEDIAVIRADEGLYEAKNGGRNRVVGKRRSSAPSVHLTSST